MSEPLRVLVFEDDADTASTYRALLQLQGMAVRTAPDGPSALAADKDFHPDVVLLDIALPGLNGWKVARQLRDEDDRPVFIVAVTGFGPDADRRRSAEAGIDLHLVKPVAPERLVGLLERFGRVVR
jgi:two-component system CheB/CheR fusion protein